MDDFIKSILFNTKNIVIIGASSNPKKDSFIVMKHLQEKGFKIIPINPSTSKTKILGEKVYKDIYEIDNNIEIDIVDIFRPSAEIFNLINKILKKNIKTIWLQLRIFSFEYEKKLQQLEINFIQNKCIKIEYENILN